MLQCHFKTTVIFLAAVVISYLSSGNVYAESGSSAKMTDIKVLSIKGCEATPPTIDLVKSVAAEMNINIDLNVIVVETPEQAQENRFIGSPTVQINGIDIEPASRKTELFGVT